MLSPASESTQSTSSSRSDPGLVRETAYPTLPPSVYSFGRPSTDRPSFARAKRSPRLASSS